MTQIIKEYKKGCKESEILINNTKAEIVSIQDDTIISANERGIYKSKIVQEEYSEADAIIEKLETERLRFELHIIRLPDETQIERWDKAMLENKYDTILADIDELQDNLDVLENFVKTKKTSVLIEKTK